MISYANEEIKFNGCPGCAYAKHEFELPCGMAYENNDFTLSQDWELPILGFFIVSPKRHVEKFEELRDTFRHCSKLIFIEHNKKEAEKIWQEYINNY